MTKTFYSNGKLLLTGEYVVLNGAKALALPTKLGQSLEVTSTQSQDVSWKSFDSDDSCWFETKISFDLIKNPESVKITDAVTETLITILHHAYLMNPEILSNTGYKVVTKLTFPRAWGLGTSSTLINNIAQWFGIDAFVLLQKSFGGSGYDVACAQCNQPLLYHLDDDAPIVQLVEFKPPFATHLYFVYLNKKQNSKAAIASYFSKQHQVKKTIQNIDLLTEKILTTTDLNVFVKCLETHEALMSDVLEMHTVQETFFSDFNGFTKSLGAWGGDFILAISKEDPTSYFLSKGFPVVIPYKDLIL